jgi:hypothetical protein
MILETPKYRYYESKIVGSRGQDKATIVEAALKTAEYIRQLDYIMDRFIEDYGSKLDDESTRNQVYFSFTEAKSREYAEATRMNRLLAFYNGKQPVL